MDMIGAQQGVAVALVADNPHGNWERLVADIEIEEDESGYRIDTISFAVVRATDNSLSIPDFELSDETRRAVIALYRERLDNAGDKIGSFGLEIDRDGQYRFDISYDPPDRINGNFDSEKLQRINNYLATYKPAE